MQYNQSINKSNGVITMFYVFIGQANVTYGTPHKITGRHDIHGDLKAFKTKKDRDCFYDNYYSNDGFMNCYKTNKREAKSKFFAGMTQLQFEDHLKYIDNRYY